jgi:hypothetical protein
VIAFVVQIIVFIAQSAASNAQLLRAEEVHGSTIRALATIEEKSEGTRQTVNTMSDQMLGAVIDKVRPLGGGSAAFAARGEEYSRVLRAAMGSDVSRQDMGDPGLASSPTRARSKAARLPVPRGKRLDAAADALSQLAGPELDTLRWLGRDFKSFAGALPGEMGHGVEGGMDRKIYDSNLARRIRAEWDSRTTIWVLTDLGRDAAALLFGGLPDDAPPAAHEARARLAKFDAKMDEAAAEEARMLADVPVEEEPGIIAAEGSPGAPEARP